MKVLLAYSSRTGNTEKLCKGVANAIGDQFDIDLMTVKEIDNFDDYDVIIIGFWVDKGSANKEAKKQIVKLKDKRVILLGTIGAAPDSEHGQKVYKTVNQLVDPSNDYLGSFLARGKVDPRLAKSIKFLPLPSGIKDQMAEASATSRATNEQDIANAVEFVKSVLK